jgi:hypothetical protein
MRAYLRCPVTAACPLIRQVLAYRSATVRDDAWNLPGICLTRAWRLGGGLLEGGLEREAAELPGLLARHPLAGMLIGPLYLRGQRGDALQVFCRDPMRALAQDYDT